MKTGSSDRSQRREDSMAGTLPHNLRVPIALLVGREAELSDLVRTVASHRLVTVSGPGGSGKTRLVAELGQRLIVSQPAMPVDVDELWWLDLGDVSELSELVHLCARLLGVRLEADGRDPMTALTARIGDRRAMLVFDTCEHLLGPVGDLVERLLAGCPGIVVVTTSREPLGVDGEAVWRIPALGPGDAAELFVLRARLVSHGLVLVPEDPLVRAVCERLDGLPLALELASAWTRALSVEQILHGLDERFRLLTGGLRRGAPRHRTLEASMSWSHDLLLPGERRVFRELAVLGGGFDLGEAEAVCSAPPDGADEVAEVLTRLVDKSLLAVARNGDRVRYRMLDTVREYAMGRLVDADEAAEARDRHLSWCLQVLRQVDRALREDQDAALRSFDGIEANALAALDWALQPDQMRRMRGRELAHLMTMPWFLRSRTHQGRPLLNRALVLTPEPDDGLQDLLASDAALLAVVAGRRGPRPAPDDDSDPITAEGRVARARFGLAEAFHAFFADHELCEQEGRAAANEAAAADDPFVEDFARIVAAYALTARERHAEARKTAEPAARRARERGDRFCTAFALGIEQYAAMQTGRLTEAVALGREMVAVAEPLGDYLCLGTLSANLALALCLSGDRGEARRAMARVVDATESTTEIDVVGLPVPMGWIHLLSGDLEGAERWFGRGVARLDGDRPDSTTAARCLPGRIEALRRLGRTDEASALADRGQALGLTTPEFLAGLTEQRGHLRPPGDPLALALHRRALEIRIRAGLRTHVPDSLDAIAAGLSGDQPANAVRLLAASTTVRAAMPRPRTAGQLVDHDALLARLGDVLGTEAFDEAWNAGMQADLDEAYDLAQRGRRRPARPGSGWASLTPAETAVVRLIEQGMTNADIARHLVITAATVKTHLYHVFAKLGVTNRTELAAVARDHPGSNDQA
jgi:predicted ATPase/DNA-binding CsgD family transcriptional regulator